MLGVKQPFQGHEAVCQGEGRCGIPDQNLYNQESPQPFMNEI